jgi:HEAT repeat protein
MALPQSDLASNAAPRAPSPAALDADALVQGLDDLKRGPEIQLLLISMGRAAVRPLTRFLLEPPGLHPQPRVLAAEALGAIGGPRAARALVAALCRGPLASISAALALSEEAVRNAAARELGRLGNPAAAGPLLYALRRSHLVEAGRALLRFHDARAISPLVECLNDGFTREQVSAVLLEFGQDAVDPLIGGLGRREYRDGAETPRSIERRAACARLLGALRAPRAEFGLRECLDDDPSEVRTAAAVALARVAPGAAIAERIPPLIDGLHNPRMADDCVEALLTTPSEALPPLVAAVTAEATQTEASGQNIPSGAVRAMARALARMGVPGGRALAGLSHHQSPMIRGVAIAYVAEASAALARPAIAEALRDPDGRVRRTAAGSARRLGLRTSHPGVPRLLGAIGRLCRLGLSRLLERSGHA